MDNATDTQQTASVQDNKIVSVELYDVAVALNAAGEIVDFDVRR